MNEPTPDQLDAAAYRYLADLVIKWFNPADGDGAEDYLLGKKIRQIGKFVESLPCTCDEGAAEFNDEPCGRCLILGRVEDQSVEW